MSHALKIFRITFISRDNYLFPFSLFQVGFFLIDLKQINSQRPVHTIIDRTTANSELNSREKKLKSLNLKESLL